MIVGQKHFSRLLNPGGKPATWYPPGLIYISGNTTIHDVLHNVIWKIRWYLSTSPTAPHLPVLHLPGLVVIHLMSCGLSSTCRVELSIAAPKHMVDLHQAAKVAKPETPILCTYNVCQSNNSTLTKAYLMSQARKTHKHRLHALLPWRCNVSSHSCLVWTTITNLDVKA